MLKSFEKLPLYSLSGYFGTNVRFIKTGTKHRSVLLLPFVPVFLKQTLRGHSITTWTRRGGRWSKQCIGKRVLVQKPSYLGHPLVSIDAKQGPEGSEKVNVPEH